MRIGMQEVMWNINDYVPRLVYYHISIAHVTHPGKLPVLVHIYDVVAIAVLNGLFFS